jgi:hypothetical protein
MMPLVAVVHKSVTASSGSLRCRVDAPRMRLDAQSGAFLLRDEQEVSADVFCCGARVRCWHLRDLVSPADDVRLSGVKRTSQPRWPSPDASRSRVKDDAGSG